MSRHHTAVAIERTAAARFAATPNEAGRLDTGLAFDIFTSGLMVAEQQVAAEKAGAGVVASLEIMRQRSTRKGAPAKPTNGATALPSSAFRSETGRQPSPAARDADGDDVIALVCHVGVKGFREPERTPAPARSGATVDGEDVVALARQVGLQRIKPADDGASS